MRARICHCVISRRLRLLACLLQLLIARAPIALATSTALTPYTVTNVLLPPVPSGGAPVCLVDTVGSQLIVLQPENMLDLIAYTTDLFGNRAYKHRLFDSAPSTSSSADELYWKPSLVLGPAATQQFYVLGGDAYMNYNAVVQICELDFSSHCTTHVLSAPGSPASFSGTQTLFEPKSGYFLIQSNDDQSGTSSAGLTVCTAARSENCTYFDASCGGVVSRVPVGGVGQFGLAASLAVLNWTFVSASANGGDSNRLYLILCQFATFPILCSCYNVSALVGADVVLTSPPELIVLPSTSAILVALFNQAAGGAASLVVCNATLYSCTCTLRMMHQDNAFEDPITSYDQLMSSAVDEPNDQLLIAFTNAANVPSLLQCDLAGEACTGILDLSQGTASGSQNGSQIYLASAYINGQQLILRAVWTNFSDGLVLSIIEPAYCNPGSYSLTSVSPCQLCPAGTFAPVQNSRGTPCTPCREGTFAIGGAQACLNCPLSRTSAEQATSMQAFVHSGQLI